MAQSPDDLMTNLLRVWLDGHFDRSSYIAMKLDGNVEIAQRLERFIELDLAPVNIETTRFHLLRNIGRGDGAEQVVAFTYLTQECEMDGCELLGQRLSVSFLARRAAHSGGLHLLDDRAVRGSSLNRQLARQQIISSISVGHLHHVSAMAEFLHIFFQNDFHTENLL